MSRYHTLLLAQLKCLGIDANSKLPTAEQLSQLLDRVSLTYAEVEEEQTSQKMFLDNSALELRYLHNNIEESQRISGFGNWSFNIEKKIGHWSKECSRIFGLISSSSMPSYLTLARKIHKDDRIHFKRKLKAVILEGKDFELECRVLLEGGESRWALVKAAASKNNQGDIVGLSGTTLDITRRKVAQLQQTIEHAITRMLAEHTSQDDVIPEIIQTVCEALNWVGGAYWTVNKQHNALQRAASWSVSSKQIKQFFYASESFIDSPHYADLIGTALRAGTAIWHQDVTQNEYFMRIDAAKKSGLRAAIALPIQVGGEILGVVEIFNTQTQIADQEILRSANFIGRQIGQFLQRKKTENALRESEMHFRALVEQASDSFYVHDIEGHIIDVNQRAYDCLGYTKEEILSMTINEIDLDLSIADLKYLRNQVSSKAPISVESRHKHKNGTIFPVDIRVGPIEINGQHHFLSLVRDVTERKELQDHIHHMAYHDPLTDLPNRTMFNHHLSHAITQARRYSRGLAVLFIDLDRFKNINDTLGHNIGDQLIQEMGQRISSCLRGGDIVARPSTSADMVARLGGDEFVVLIEEVKDSTRISYVAEKILTAIVKEFKLDDQLIHITASIGISTFPEDGHNDFTLMKHADIALYRAKERGKNNFQFYSAHMDLHSAELLALESGLRRAVERNEFILLYQAKVETQTGRITGVEALVRWQHPELGLVSPVHFIPIAEESGLIVPLSQWVLKAACRQSREWQKQGLPDLQMAVNLSARQFVNDDLLEDTINILLEVGMNPKLLELEITEGMMMHNTEKTIHVLNELRKLGIQVAIDDFGIGYSSLSQLKQFPIDILKIDRSFIKDIPGDKSDEAITAAIIAMGRSLKIKVVAEGVETAEQLQFLSNLECHLIQGYFFSRPVSPDEITRMVREQTTNLLPQSN